MRSLLAALSLAVTTACFSLPELEPTTEIARAGNVVGAPPVLDGPIEWCYNDGGSYDPSFLIPSDPSLTFAWIGNEGFSRSTDGDPRSFYFLLAAAEGVSTSLMPKRSDINQWHSSTVLLDGKPRAAKTLPWTWAPAHDSLWIALEVDPSELGTHQRIEYALYGKRLEAKTSLYVGSADFERAISRARAQSSQAGADRLTR